MRPLVLYHGPTCFDGFCAAWLMWRHLREDCEFRPVQYGEPPPDVEGRDVFVLDFSYSRPTLEAINRRARSLVVLDHHKTAQVELEGLPYCTFDLNLSGAQLTWSWLAQRDLAIGEPSWLVDYTADRDLWRFALPDSRAVNAVVRSFGLDFALWDELDRRSPKDLVGEGRAILRAESVMVADHVARAREVVLDGHKVLAVNATALFSEIAGRLAEASPSGIGVAWFVREDLQVQFSLRSRDGVDVSEIAKAHGGGGHQSAAGFEVGGLSDVWEVLR